MLATDPLSLVFLGCVVFSGAFLLISTLTGVGHGHALHLGHAGHAGQVGHVGHVGHAGGHAASHATHATAGHAAHAGAQNGAGAPGHAPPASPLSGAWTTVSETLLGSLNVFGVLTFLFVFGLVGYLLHNAANLGAFLTLFLPALLGVAAAVGMSIVLTRLFAADVGLLTVEDSRLEGRLGKVSMPIRAGGVGEVIFERPGSGRQSIGARSLDGQAVAANTEIVIVNVRDGIAGVQTWDTFMRSVRTGQAPILEAIEPGMAQDH